jgi:hypothetical protein
MFEIQNHGSICVVVPHEDDVLEWLKEHTDGTWFGGLAVEPRYVQDLLNGLFEAGFEMWLGCDEYRTWTAKMEDDGRVMVTESAT